MTNSRVFLDVYMGDEEEHMRAQSAYDATAAILVKNAAIYALPSLPADLSPEQQDMLQELDVLWHPPSSCRSAC